MRLQINPDDFLRAKIVKPGWYVLLIKEMETKMNKDKTAFNDETDLEIVEPDSEYIGVPIKHWFSEKGVSMPGGAVSLIVAFEPGIDQKKMQDIELNGYKGKFIYGKIDTNRGKDGSDPPRNMVVDWAPIPANGPQAAKYAKFLDANSGVAQVAGVAGFGS